uniref:Uncharacterized protein n=1 Tax=Arundo donax TaxID=35708 RepID=A0A0A8Y4L2_ARUDO
MDGNMLWQQSYLVRVSSWLMRISQYICTLLRQLRLLRCHVYTLYQYCNV